MLSRQKSSLTATGKALVDPRTISARKPPANHKGPGGSLDDFCQDNIAEPHGMIVCRPIKTGFEPF